MKNQYVSVNHTLVSAQVESQIIEYIIRECHIGDKLPNEFELAKRFETSRSTIREVMKSIESQGMLEIRHGSGTYVRSFSPISSDPLHLSGRKDKYRLALELFDVRLMLEPEIAAMAADLISDEEAKELKELCDTVENLYLSGADHMEKDVEFHSYIAKCSGNSIVQALVPIIQSAIGTFCNVTKRQLMKETITTHRTITNAIINHDPTGARCAMISHLAYNRTMILDMMRGKSKEKTSNNPKDV